MLTFLVCSVMTCQMITIDVYVHRGVEYFHHLRNSLVFLRSQSSTPLATADLVFITTDQYY